MLTPLTPHDAKQYRPLALAFLGDGIFDALIREKLVRNANCSPAMLHSQKIKLVCAAFQAEAARNLHALFTEEEETIFQRGRNAVGNHIPKHANASDYRSATGLEAVFGYLYLTGDYNRLYFLLNQIFEMTEETKI